MRRRFLCLAIFALTFLVANPAELPAIFASSHESPLLTVSLFELFNPQELHVRSTQAVIILEDLSGGRQRRTNNARLKADSSGIHALLNPTSAPGPPENLDYPAGVKITSSTGLSLSPHPQKLPFRNYRGAVKVTRRANDTLLILEEVKLEDYVTGVTAAEVKESKDSEGLKAQGVLARTFALKNKGRHGKDGYDLCDTTHCQLYQGRPSAANGALAAVRATEGEVLYRGGELAFVYYHSTCGGKTADQSDFPGDPRAAGYKSVSDEDYCRFSPHANWDYRITLEGIQQALVKDGLWPEGDMIKDISIANKGGSGRAARMRLQGNQTREIEAWDFRNAVCRAYGWSTVKSTLLEMEKQEDKIIFRGRGLGHGLGLCQHGAMEMARRGFNYREILKHYYPGFEIKGNVVGAWRAMPLQNTTQAAERATGLSPIQQAQSEHFLLYYPSPGEENQILLLLENAYKTLKERYDYRPQDLLKVTFYASTENYCRATGQPWWLGAATTLEGMHFQPVGVLQKKGGVATYILHEYTHWMVQEVGKGRSPYWLNEGLALLESGEGKALEKERWGGVTPPLQEIEENLRTAQDKETLRQNYYWAYKYTRCLEMRFGREKILKFINLLGQGTEEAEAGKLVFGEGWEGIREKICSSK